MKNSEYWQISHARNNRYIGLFIVALTSLSIILGGCTTAPIEQKPFTKFAELAAGDPDTLFFTSALEFEDGDPFQFKSVPRYMVYEQFKVGLRSVTDAMHKYTVLLRDFANEDIQSREEFEKFSKDLNANAFDAVKAIRDSAGEGTADNIGLISSAAATAFNSYLRTLQKKALISAVSKNQPTVEEYAESVKEAIIITAAASNKEYDDASQNLRNSMAEPNKRSAAIDSLVKLNQKHFTQTQTLKAITAAVDKFPMAYRELAAAAENSEISLGHIVELINRGNQLKIMVESTQKTNQNALLESNAEQIEAKAVAFETDAKLSTLDTANAQAEAVIARIATNADPANAQKEKNAEELEKRAAQLKEIAEKKTEYAKLARASAEGIKKSVKALID